MIRKQLYIEESQERALKKRAEDLGLSEAEIVRQALDEFLGAPASQSRARQKALEEILARAEEWSQLYELPEGYRFDREALYEEEPRVAKWGKRE